MLGRSEGGGGSGRISIKISQWDIEFIKSLKRKKDQEEIRVGIPVKFNKD